VLESFLANYPGPFWTDAVRSEILENIGDEPCNEILAASFLGTPVVVGTGDLLDVFRIQVALGGSAKDPKQHLGEAECIALADKDHGGIITDDNAAYDFVERRLGTNRVIDTIEVLRASVANGDIEPSQAQQIADAVRNSGRSLRREHPTTLTAEYFR